MEGDAHSMLGRRLEQHDSNQLELKLAYDMEPEERRQRYGVEAFIFLPRTLGVTTTSYPASRFYEDTISFARLRTPRVAVHALATNGPGEKWFRIVEAPLERMMAGERLDPVPVVNGLKLLAAIVRSSIRDECLAFRERFRGMDLLSGGAREARSAELATTLGRFLDDIRLLWARLRIVGESAGHAAVDAQIREVWTAIDEYTALNVEEVCTRIVELSDGALKLPRTESLGTARRAFAEEAVQAYLYRRSRGFPSYVVPEDENESLPYRRHILKRIVSSVLYLDIRQAESGVVMTNVVGMVAAGLAMLFAVLVTLWAQLRFDMFSTTFVFAAVVSYMLKDRIKEWGKQRLGRLFARWIPDKRLEVRDQTTGEVLGECRETVTIFDATRVDPSVRQLRHVDHQGKAATDGRPETVIRYHKQVSLSSEALQKRLHGVDGLNDIIRFNLSHLRDRMDEPYELHTIVDPETRQLVTMRCARVYHVNLVLRFTRSRGDSVEVETERVRVILDQRGIKRVEPVSIGVRAPSLVRPTVQTAAVQPDYI